MSKRTLDPTDISGLIDELDHSAFFRQSQPPEPTPDTQTTSTLPNAVLASEKASTTASKHASMLASEADVLTVSKTLKFIGKEVLYVRLTQEEKNQVNEIEYTYQRQGIKTSGNEIGRIALNVLLADYKTHGAQSILAKILANLHT